MRRSTTIASASLFLLLYLCAASAQQAALPQTSGSTANQAGRSVATNGLLNCVGVQKGRIPLWTASSPNDTLCNSGIYEAEPYGHGNIGILNAQPKVALDVNGATNTSLNYQIGGQTVLGVG